jgi:dodecin
MMQPSPQKEHRDTRRCYARLYLLSGMARVGAMSDHVYKVVELVGSSTSSIEDAIQTAIKRADQTLRNLRWFEVVQTRGHVENGEVHHYQVVLKAGFTLEGEYP